MIESLSGDHVGEIGARAVGALRERPGHRAGDVIELEHARGAEYETASPALPERPALCPAYPAHVLSLGGEPPEAFEKSDGAFHGCSFSSIPRPIHSQNRITHSPACQVTTTSGAKKN